MIKTENFIKTAKAVHGDTYDYSEVEYINKETRVKIRCKQHGVFEQLPYLHKTGTRCPKCAIKARGLKRRNTSDKIMRQFKETHGDRYDYSKVVYTGVDNPVTIVCREHGEFQQRPYDHKSGQNCPICASSARKTNKFLTLEEFVRRSKEIHGDVYDYSETEYTAAFDTIKIGCKKHGAFEQIAINHYRLGQGCPSCSKSRKSTPETEVHDYVENKLGLPVVANDRKIIQPKELDIVIPSKKIAIEFNGSFWHSTEKVSRNFHKKKTEDCLKEGYTLLHIHEHQWASKRDIVKSMLQTRLVGPLNRVFARKCTIQVADVKTMRTFMETNHIQGFSGGRWHLVLTYDNEIVCGMTLGKARFSKDYDYELIRFANKLHTSVIGGAGKLLSFYRKEINNQPHKLGSYANKDYSTGNLYQQLNFQPVGDPGPGYFWSNGVSTLSRYMTMKHKLQELLKDKFDKNKSEAENMRSIGYFKVFDSGQQLYVKTMK